jgi:hypothetical protein
VSDRNQGQKETAMAETTKAEKTTGTTAQPDAKDPPRASDGDDMTRQLVALLQELVSGRAPLTIREQGNDAAVREVQLQQTRTLTQLTERLTTLPRTVSPPPASTGMDADQARVEVRFRALQTALGGGGRLRPTLSSALMRSPQLDKDDCLHFIDDLPHGAVSVVLTHRQDDGRVTEERLVAEHLGTPPVVPDAGDVIAVEIRDGADRALQFGIPVRAPEGRLSTRRN